MKINSRIFSIKAAICILVVVLFIMGMVFVVMHQQDELELDFYQVKSEKVSNNIRVVLLSDLHLKEFGKDNIQLVEAVQKLSPDIIAIVGDMNMSGNPDVSVVITLCQQLVRIAPVYYSLGNHEYVDVIFHDSNIIEAINATGAVVLSDDSKKISVGETEILLGGLSQGHDQFERYGHQFFDTYIKDEHFKLLLVHYPELFDGILEKYPIDLALCGHAHGGLVRLPFVGGLYAPNQGFFPQLTEGYHEIENSKVIISRGLGSSHPVPRINNKPEIVIVDINWY